VRAARRTLIVKLGALGDVVRTTPLLERLPGSITWVTEGRAAPLLRGHPRVRVVPIEDAARLHGSVFDLSLSLDEDARACRVASSVRARRRVGVTLRAGRHEYCEASAPWFDMSLVSRLGRSAADALKARNRRSYQEHLFAALGLRFREEECWLPARPAWRGGRRVALEPRVGPVWPGKAWEGFAELERGLVASGFEPVLLRQRPTLRRYIDDINGCDVLVAGDTLAMHVALALRKPTVAIFNCTSPHEIFGYGRLRRVVNRRLADFFYTRRRLPAAAAVPVATVLAAVRRAAAAGIDSR
jgi:heptosyltransferase-2